MTYVQTLIDDAAKSVGSKYRLAQLLNANESFIGKVAKGTKQISPGMAARAAALIGLDPRQAALQTIVDSEPDAAKREQLAEVLGVQPTTQASTSSKV